MPNETSTAAGAEAIARKWANRETAPRDHMPEVREWETEEAVRDMIKTADLDQRQFVEEVNRRKNLTHGVSAERFIEKYPWNPTGDMGLLIPFGAHVDGHGREVTPDQERAMGEFTDQHRYTSGGTEAYYRADFDRQFPGLNYDDLPEDFRKRLLDGDL